MINSTPFDEDENGDVDEGNSDSLVPIHLELPRKGHKSSAVVSLNQIEFTLMKGFS